MKSCFDSVSIYFYYFWINLRTFEKMHACIHSPADDFDYLKKRTCFSKLSEQILV